MTEPATGATTGPFPRTVRATGPEDLLALVPTLLGFHPRRSVVVLTVGRARQPVHARVDLPEGPSAVQDLAAHLSGVAGRAGVTSTALVLYTGDPVLARAVTDALVRSLEAERVEVVCVVRAEGSRWWTLHSGGGEELGGTSFDVTSHPLTARSVVEGTVVLGSRAALVDSLRGDPAVTAETGRLAEEVLAGWRHPVGPSPRGGAGDGDRDRDRDGGRAGCLATEGRWLRRRVRRFLTDGRRLEPADAARLAALVTVSVVLRDVAWAEMTHRDAVRHVDLWRDVVRRAPRHLQAAPAGLLGFSAWLSGNGALAWCAVDCAEAAQPGYGLAELLRQTLTAAVPPSVWRPPPPPDLRLVRDGRRQPAPTASDLGSPGAGP